LHYEELHTGLPATVNTIWRVRRNGEELGWWKQGMHTEFWWETFLKVEIYILEKSFLKVLFTLSKEIPK
jgi:hypothetical protein